MNSGRRFRCCGSTTRNCDFAHGCRYWKSSSDSTVPYLGWKNDQSRMTRCGPSLDWMNPNCFSIASGCVPAHYYRHSNEMTDCGRRVSFDRYRAFVGPSARYLECPSARSVQPSDSSLMNESSETVRAPDLDHPGTTARWYRYPAACANGRHCSPTDPGSNSRRCDLGCAPGRHPKHHGLCGPVDARSYPAFAIACNGACHNNRRSSLHKTGRIRTSRAHNALHTSCSSRRRDHANRTTNDRNLSRILSKN